MKLERKSAVGRLPGLSAVVGAEDAGGRDGDVHALRVRGVEQDRVQAHAAGARRPFGPRLVGAQPGELVPGLAAVGRAEERGVLDPGIDRVRVDVRRLEVPDALELPGVGCPVVPLVRAGGAVVEELVPHRLPGLAAVVGAMDHLAEPVADLRGVDPIRIDRRPLQVVDFQAAEVRPGDLPVLALAIGRQDEGALVCPHQNSHPAHLPLLDWDSPDLPGRVPPDSVPDDSNPNSEFGGGRELGTGQVHPAG